jgi:hypothetical protein
VIAPSLASKPAIGTWNPVSVTVTDGPFELMRSRPSKIARFRGGSVASA